MWEQNYTPVAESLGASTVVAAIPLVILFVMLGVMRKPGWIAGLSALGAAVLLAVGIYGMPVPQAGMSMVNGAAFGLFPIGWIVIASLILYHVTVETGKFEIIKDERSYYGLRSQFKHHSLRSWNQSLHCLWRE